VRTTGFDKGQKICRTLTFGELGLAITSCRTKSMEIRVKIHFGTSVASHARPKFLIGLSEGLEAERATGGC
jgi:hypothetical protein